MKTRDLIRIGVLANHYQVSVETLRFYESEGLITPKHRSPSGYRLYSCDDQQRLNFILQAKKVGFSLQEIKQLLSLRADKDAHTCEEVKSYTGKKIQEIESKIADLVSIKVALNNLYQACCGGSESATDCTILSSLDKKQLFTAANTSASSKNAQAIHSSEPLKC